MEARVLAIRSKRESIHAHGGRCRQVHPFQERVSGIGLQTNLWDHERGEIRRMEIPHERVSEHHAVVFRPFPRSHLLGELIMSV